MHRIAQGDDQSACAATEEAKVPDLSSLRSQLLEIEPELGTLVDVIAALQIFAEASDHIDPRAIALLARVGGEAVEQVDAAWRSVTRSGTTVP
jgi:hypothetical protein